MGLRLNRWAIDYVRTWSPVSKNIEKERDFPFFFEKKKYSSLPIVGHIYRFLGKWLGLETINLEKNCSVGPTWSVRIFFFGELDTKNFQPNSKLIEPLRLFTLIVSSNLSVLTVMARAQSQNQTKR